jgi:hypothetical protein
LSPICDRHEQTTLINDLKVARFEVFLSLSVAGKIFSADMNLLVRHKLHKLLNPKLLAKGEIILNLPGKTLKREAKVIKKLMKSEI